jgi:valyl-tRNA synthetase
MAVLMEIVTAIRNIRGEMGIAPSVTLTVILKPPDRDTARRLEGLEPLIRALARSQVTIDPAAARPPASAMAMVGTVECYVPLGDAVDLQAERLRLTREVRKAEEEIAFLEGKLARSEYRTKAPPDVVERDERRLADQQTRRAKLEESLRWLHESSPV